MQRAGRKERRNVLEKGRKRKRLDGDKGGFCAYFCRNHPLNKAVDFGERPSVERGKRFYKKLFPRWTQVPKAED